MCGQLYKLVLISITCMLVFSHLLSSLDCGRRRASEIHWPLMAAGSGHLGMNKTSKSTNRDWTWASVATHGCWLGASGHKQNITQPIVTGKNGVLQTFHLLHNYCKAGKTSWYDLIRKYSQDNFKTKIINWNPVLTNDNDNNAHLSCAHQRPERSHDTYKT